MKEKLRLSAWKPWEIFDRELGLWIHSEMVYLISPLLLSSDTAKQMCLANKSVNHYVQLGIWLVMLVVVTFYWVRYWLGAILHDLESSLCVGAITSNLKLYSNQSLFSMKSAVIRGASHQALLRFICFWVLILNTV